MVGRHQASRAVAVLPVADRPTEDDSTPMDVFTVATRIIVKRTVYFTNSNLLQHPVGFLAARVVAVMVVRPHFKAHRCRLTPASRALHHYPDRYLSSIYPNFSLSININTALRCRGTRVTHRPTRHLLGVRDPIVLMSQVLGPVSIAQARVMIGVKERPLSKYMRTGGL